MTVQELSRKISSDIHNRMFQPNHFKADFGDYEKCFTSLDLIEDCQDAIDEFISIPESIVPKRSVLNIYGVLQATYGQQDGLFGLYENISREKFKNIGEFFSLFEFDNGNREIRDDVIHSSSRRYNREFYFIDKGQNSKYKFSYAGYSPEFVVKKVDIKKIIDEQSNLATTVLIKVIEMINEKVNQHKEKHKSDSLHSIVSNLNYSIQLICQRYTATHIAKPHQPTLKPKLGKECVCPTARPKRPTNQRTKKNTEAITSPIRKQGFRAS
jgi:hypothetical protein